MRTLDILRNSCVDGTPSNDVNILNVQSNTSQATLSTGTHSTGFYLLHFELLLAISGNGYTTSDKLDVSIVSGDYVHNASQYSNNFFSNSNVFPKNQLAIVENKTVYISEDQTSENLNFVIKTTSPDMTAATELHYTLSRIF